MTAIASLDVDLSLNAAKFVEGLKKARKEHEDFVKSLQEFSERASSFGESLGIKVNSDFSMGGMIEKAQEAQQSQAKLTAVLRATGEAAGISAAGMARIREELAGVTSFSQEASRSAETVLATFTSVRGDQFEGAMKAASDLATVFNMDLSTAAEKVGRALENPADGLRSLAKMGVQFTEDQKKTIQSLVDVGETAKAQQEILGAINAKVGGSAEAASKTAMGSLQRLKNQYDELAETIGSAVLPAVTVAENAINGITSATDAASKATKLYGQISSLVSATLSGEGMLFGAVSAMASPVGLAAMLAVGTAVALLASEMRAETAETEAAAKAHKEAAEAAQRHADALRMVVKAAEDAADKRNKVMEELDHRVHGSGTGPLSNQIRDQVQQWQQQLNEILPTSRLLDPAQAKTVDNLRSNIAKGTQDFDYQRGQEAAEESTRQAREMQSRADAIRESIMTPMDKFQATIRELSSLVSNHALDPISASVAQRKAFEDLSKSTSPPQEAAAALAQGTAAAYSAALQNDRGSRNPLVELAQNQLKETQDQSKTFGEMLGTLKSVLGHDGDVTVVSM